MVILFRSGSNFYFEPVVEPAQSIRIKAGRSQLVVGTTRPGRCAIIENRTRGSTYQANAGHMNFLIFQ